VAALFAHSQLFSNELHFGFLANQYNASGIDFQ